MEFKNSDAVTLAAQLVSPGESRRASADDSDALVAHRRRALKPVTLRKRGITDELLHRVNADKIINVVAVTTIFAGCRTDSPHHGGKGIGLSGPAKRIFLPCHILKGRFHATNNLQPAAYILARGATTLARRRAMNISGALVRVICIKNVFLEVMPLVISLFILSKSQIRGVFFGNCHREIPLIVYRVHSLRNVQCWLSNTSASPINWWTLIIMSISMP